MSIIAAAVDVVSHKNLIKHLAFRDIKLRYERSALGFLWTLLNPLIMIAIYTIFFSGIVKIGIERYPVFLVSVLLPWNFLSRGILSVAALPYNNSYILNRATFPAESLVFGGLISSFIDLCFELIVFTILLIAFQSPLFPGILMLPLIMLIYLLFTAGISLFLAVGYVLYRDMQYISGIIATAWMYLTPVFYSHALVPEMYLSFYNLNPMVYIASCFREVLYHGRFPQIQTLAIASSISVVVFIVGWVFFNKYKQDFPEIA